MRRWTGLSVTAISLLLVQGAPAADPGQTSGGGPAETRAGWRKFEHNPVLGGKQKAVATRVAAGPSKEIETTDPRELKPERGSDEAEAAEVEPLVTSQS